MYVNYDAFIGVDPGTNGAISPYDGTTATCRPLENDFAWMLQTFSELKHLSGRCLVCIEKPALHLREIQSSAKNGGKAKIKVPQIAIVHRLMTLFENSWALAHAAHACGFHYCMVQPRTWQGFLQLGKVEGENTTQRKARYREIARAMYPALKVTTKTQDAILIMEYVRRRWRLEPSWFNGRIVKPGKFELKLF